VWQPTSSGEPVEPLADHVRVDWAPVLPGKDSIGVVIITVEEGTLGTLLRLPFAECGNGDRVEGEHSGCGIDDRVDTTARHERATVDRYPIGSPEKQSALVRMKHAELAARNQPGGYWVAASDPNVVTHALSGKASLDGLRRTAVLTDGAARIVALFELTDWSGLLDILDEAGPDEVVRRIRAIEAADPEGRRWLRNKRSDDATIVYAR
jgi:hypothetical protein